MSEEHALPKEDICVESVFADPICFNKKKEPAQRALWRNLNLFKKWKLNVSTYTDPKT